MKVNGQLELAQFEQIADASPTPTPTGRVYADITNPLKAIPKFFDGTNWKSLGYAETTQVILANSGKAITVDWSQSLIWKVSLTDGAVISFANAVPGEIHTLIIMQTPVGNIPYPYALDMPDEETNGAPIQPTKVIACGSASTYQWVYQPNATFGYNFAEIPATGNSFSTVADPSGMRFSLDGTALAMGASVSPFVTFYDVYPYETDYSAPFSQRNTPSPTVLAGRVYSVCFDPKSNIVYSANGTTPFVQSVYRLTGQASATSAVQPNPGTLPAGVGNYVDCHPTGLWLTVGHNTTPFFSVYPTFAPGFFGTKLANPGILPANNSYTSIFNPLGDYIVNSCFSAPYLSTYPFTITTSPLTGAIGAQGVSPTLPFAPASSLQHAAWRPQGDFLAVALGANGLYVVPFDRASGSYGTPLNVAVSLPAAVTSICWSPCGTYLYMAGGSPFLGIIDFENKTLTNLVSFSGSISTSTITIAAHPNGRFIALCTSTGVMSWVKAPRRAKNYVRLNRV